MQQIGQVLLFHYTQKVGDRCVPLLLTCSCCAAGHHEQPTLSFPFMFSLLADVMLDHNRSGNLVKQTHKQA